MCLLVVIIFNYLSEGNFFCFSRCWVILCVIFGFLGNNKVINGCCYFGICGIAVISFCVYFCQRDFFVSDKCLCRCYLNLEYCFKQLGVMLDGRIIMILFV